MKNVKKMVIALVMGLMFVGNAGAMQAGANSVAPVNTFTAEENDELDRICHKQEKKWKIEEQARRYRQLRRNARNQIGVGCCSYVPSTVLTLLALPLAGLTYTMSGVFADSRDGGFNLANTCFFGLPLFGVLFLVYHLLPDNGKEALKAFLKKHGIATGVFIATVAAIVTGWNMNRAK